jgi:hypothetical protein
MRGRLNVRFALEAAHYTKTKLRDASLFQEIPSTGHSEKTPR